MPVTTNNYAGLIKALRQYLELSKEAFGKSLGYSGAHITRLENGITEPSDTVINKICEVYGVKSDYFNGEVELKDAVAAPITKEENNRIVGERLRITRSEKGLTIKELSFGSGVSEPFISLVENGKYLLNEKTAEKLAAALEVGIDWLLTGDESKKEYPVDGKMTEWLWKHPEVREEIWKRMESDSICELSECSDS